MNPHIARYHLHQKMIFQKISSQSEQLTLSSSEMVCSRRQSRAAKDFFGLELVGNGVASSQVN